MAGSPMTPAQKIYLNLSQLEYKLIDNHSYYSLAMYICLCKSITDSDIKRELEAGATSLAEIQSSLGVASVCGSCACHAKDVVKQHHSSIQSDKHSLFYPLSNA
jgi:bacterioferritin-associated ferredoxin